MYSVGSRIIRRRCPFYAKRCDSGRSRQEAKTKRRPISAWIKLWAKKNRLAGRFLASLRLRLRLSASHRKHWRGGHVIELFLLLQRNFLPTISRCIRDPEQCFQFLVSEGNTDRNNGLQNARYFHLRIAEPRLTTCDSGLICSRSHPGAAVGFGWWPNGFTPSDTVLHPCRNDDSEGFQPAASPEVLACSSEGTRDPVSALEIWPPTLEAKTYEAFVAYVEPRMEIVESVPLLRVPARPL